MTPTQKTQAETEAMRALEALFHAEAIAPSGICKQWVQLARVRVEALQHLIHHTNTQA
ncbi:hypothetical protein [Aquabacterium sp.]|uniref:hypothetical protein n=1 Tax=Aquabacterium sp. TaxID=1872578 RepID=UPI0025BF1AD3|nr:hypothetical protein [Aquabacterium sp.]